MASSKSATRCRYRRLRRLCRGFERLEDRWVLNIAYGDFDGDGFQDMAVGIPGEGVPSVGPISQDVVRAGSVQIIYGSPLADPTVDDQFLQQRSGLNDRDRHVIDDYAERDDQFGTALAVGNFNGDVNPDTGLPIDDLAIGVPGEDIQGVVNAGAVNIVYGSVDGITLEDNLILTQDTVGMAEQAEDNDRFGSVLSSGDYNGDGLADLAIGVPNEDLRSSANSIEAVNNAGLVHVVYGQPVVGLAVAGNKTFDQKLLMGSSQLDNFDNFGAALASADYNGDGFDDLAIGIPGEDPEVPDEENGGTKKIQDAGAINLVWGAAGLGLDANANRYYDKSMPGVLGAAQPFANFGATLAAGNFDGDPYFDLAIGVVNEDRFTQINAGAVNVLYGNFGDTGFNLIRTQHWDEGMVQIQGDAESEDHFGGALATGDFNGDGLHDLAIGVPGEDYNGSGSTIIGNAGGVYVFFASSTGTGIVTTNQKKLAQFMTDLEDDIENNDYFGGQLAAGDMTGGGVADLAIGVPGEDMHGAVHVVPGLQDSFLFQTAWDKLWSQDSIGVSDSGEVGDLFGGPLSSWVGPQYVTSAIIPEEALSLHSKPGAAHTLFLDFSGGFSPHNRWDIDDQDFETPVFDFDGNDTYFGRFELDVIEHVWAIVAEDFAPFDIDVTTDEGAFIPGQHFRVLIGGDGTERGVIDPEGSTTLGWAGNQPFGGDNYLHADRQSDVYAFSEDFNPVGRIAVRLAATATHEAGHAFGLKHKNEVDSDGENLDTNGDGMVDVGDGCSGPDAYGKGPDEWSPIMGNDSSGRTIWTEDGEVVSPNRFINVLLACSPDGQPDGTINTLVSGMGLDADDHGDTAPNETSLGVLSTSLVGTGIISRLIDVDLFTFEVATAGVVSVDLLAADTTPNLDAKLRLTDGSTTIVSATVGNPNESVDWYLEPGVYTIEVSSQAIMAGDLGQYTVRISVPDSHLVVRGTLDDDDITIRQSSSDLTQLEIDVNGNVTTHPLAAIKTITVYGREGEDTISIQDLPDQFSLGSGMVTTEMTIDVRGGSQNDTIVLARLAAGVTVNVDGGIDDDTLHFGSGDVGAVDAHVRYFGAGGNDALIVDDTNGLVGRDYLFDRIDNAGTVMAQDAGPVQFEDDVEYVRLNASDLVDHINVEALAEVTALELFGYASSDEFRVAELSQSVEQVLGELTIHGGSGKVQDFVTFEDFDNWKPENNDRVYVYDQANPIVGNYKVDASGIYNDYEFEGTIARSQPGVDINGMPIEEQVFLVTYDEIEFTYLYADQGNNDVDFRAAPRFNTHSIEANDGKDLVIVRSTPAMGPLYVQGNGGSDTIRVTEPADLRSLRSAVHVDGGADAELDRLYVNDYDAPTSSYTLTSSEFHVTTPANLGPDSLKVDYSAIEYMDIQLNSLHNQITVVSTDDDTQIDIDGREGSDTITMLSADSQVTFYGGVDASPTNLDRAIWQGDGEDNEFIVAGNAMGQGAGWLTTDNGVERREINGLGGIDLLRVEGVATASEVFEILPNGFEAHEGEVLVGNWQPVYYYLEDLAVVGNLGNTDRLRVHGPGIEENYFDINLGAHGTHASPLAVLSYIGGELMRLRSATGLTSGGTFATPAVEFHAPSLYGEFNVIAPNSAPPASPLEISVYGEGSLAELNVVHMTGATVDHQLPDDAIPGQVTVDYDPLAYEVTYYGINAVATDVLLPGDYDGNGIVDEGDYDVWKDHFGEMVEPYTNGDGNGDGKVNIGDYPVWRNNLGAILPKAPIAAISVLAQGAPFSGNLVQPDSWMLSNHERSNSNEDYQNLQFTAEPFRGAGSDKPLTLLPVPITDRTVILKAKPGTMLSIGARTAKHAAVLDTLFEELGENRSYLNL